MSAHTDDRQVESYVSSRRFSKVHSTSVNAGVHFRHVVDGQYGRFGKRAEVRSALECLVFPMRLVRIRKLVPDVHAGNDKENYTILLLFRLRFVIL